MIPGFQTRSDPVARLVRASLLVLALSTGVYAFAWLLQEVGDLDFYSPREHALLSLYAASCYVAVEVAMAIVPAKPGARYGYWRPFLASVLLAAAISSLIFIGMRVWVGGGVAWAGVAANVAMVLLMFHFAIAGIAMTHRYVAERDANQAALRAAERESLLLERKLFQQQFEPHFLFNNLNILSALIRTHPVEAEAFAERLAGVCRHLLRFRGADLISLHEELGCARDYAGLASLRFGAAYRLVVAPEVDAVAAAQRVVPGLLLELLGNLIKHNQASAESVLELRLAVDADRLVASNARRSRRLESRRGEGLALLSARYRLLAGRPIDISEDATSFRVSVPMIPLAAR